MKILYFLIRGIDQLNDRIGKGVSWITLILVLVIFTDVVMRYLFNTSYVFVQEMEWHLFALIFLLGAGFTLKHDKHVRVDVLYQRMSPRLRAWVNLLGVLFFLFPGAWLVIYTSIPYIQNSFSVLEGSPDPGGVPYRFLLKAAIPLGYILIALQGLVLALRSLFVILNLEPSKKS